MTNLLEVDFGVRTHTGFADEVDDPLLAFVTREVESLGEVPKGQRRTQ